MKYINARYEIHIGKVKKVIPMLFIPLTCQYFCFKNIVCYLQLSHIFKRTSDQTFHGSKHYEL